LTGWLLFIDILPNIGPFLAFSTPIYVEYVSIIYKLGEQNSSTTSKYTPSK
jgi:hypothetical protein